MMKKHLISMFLPTMLGLALALPAKADLQGEMNQLFDNLGNVTDPTITSTARRGVIAGGSVQIRNRIVDTNLVTLTPPSFQAGCGGVDLFGGSFSFVSGDQIVPLLKAVASNAVGYAFQIGLSAICETCFGAIETMQKKVQALNQHFGNSCQLAQGLVNDGLDAAGYKNHNDASIIATANGAREDIFDAQTSDAQGDAQQAAPEEVAERITGNIVWRALVTQNADARFAFGDTELLEVMMNLTGSIIVAAPADDGTGTTSNVIHIPANHLLFDAMLDGGDVSIAGCDGQEGPNECLEPVQRTITLEGFKERARLLLLGDEGTPGIIAKLRDSELQLSEEDTVLLNALPSGAGGLLIRLSSISEEAAKTYVETLIPHLTTAWARIVSQDLIEAVSASTTVIDSEYAKQIRQLVEDARHQLNAEVQFRQQLYGDLPSLIAEYNGLLAVVEKPVFAVPADVTERP